MKIKKTLKSILLLSLAAGLYSPVAAVPDQVNASSKNSQENNSNGLSKQSTTTNSILKFRHYKGMVPNKHTTQVVSLGYFAAEELQWFERIIDKYEQALADVRDNEDRSDLPRGSVGRKKTKIEIARDDIKRMQDFVSEARNNYIIMTFPQMKQKLDKLNTQLLEVDTKVKAAQLLEKKRVLIQQIEGKLNKFQNTLNGFKQQMKTDPKLDWNASIQKQEQGIKKWETELLDAKKLEELEKLYKKILNADIRGELIRKGILKKWETKLKNATTEKLEEYYNQITNSQTGAQSVPKNKQIKSFRKMFFELYKACRYSFRYNLAEAFLKIENSLNQSAKKTKKADDRLWNSKEMRIYAAPKHTNKPFENNSNNNNEANVVNNNKNLKQQSNLNDNKGNKAIQQLAPNQSNNNSLPKEQNIEEHNKGGDQAPVIQNSAQAQPNKKDNNSNNNKSDVIANNSDPAKQNLAHQKKAPGAKMMTKEDFNAVFGSFIQNSASVQTVSNLGVYASKEQEEEEEDEIANNSLKQQPEMPQQILNHLGPMLIRGWKVLQKEGNKALVVPLNAYVVTRNTCFDQLIGQNQKRSPTFENLLFITFLGLIVAFLHRFTISQYVPTGTTSLELKTPSDEKTNNISDNMQQQQQQQKSSKYDIRIYYSVSC